MNDLIPGCFPAICAGFGLFLVGGANLVLRNSGIIFRVAATLSAVIVTLAVATILDQPHVIAWTTLLIALGLLPCLLLANNRFVGRASALFASILVVGIGLTIGSTMSLMQAEEAAEEAALAELELLNGRIPYTPNRHIKAATDRGTPIDLKEPNRAQEGANLATLETKLIERFALDGKVIRRGPPDDRSNCHGWVFTDGRSPISGEKVAVILKENGYLAVEVPRPNDLVIYGSPVCSLHTGIVRYVSEGQPVLVEGKWGIYGVFLHAIDNSPYGTIYTFFRSPRTGHLLDGVDALDRLVSVSEHPLP